ncbi:MAG: lactam utilization protein LamB [Lutibacter sp.]|nr:MAG: lactam utilization protein LamB [Lutibacter sp.]
MKKIDINCDVGEGINNEEFLLPYIQTCNIACGGHAGDAESMQKIVMLGLEYHVKIGAHPSYPDKDNFGRLTLKIGDEQLIQSVQYQINMLNSIVTNLGGELHHIKPHGALYNDIAKNKKLALIFLTAIEKYKENTKLFVPYNSVIEKQAIKMGFSVIYEAFADRNYHDDLSLVNRKNSNALLTDVVEILNHVNEIRHKGIVTSINGTKVRIKANTFCVHSDTENAIEIVKYLSENLA